MSEIMDEALRQRILTRGRAACAMVVAGIMVFAVVGLAAPASAGTCTSKTGGSSDRLMWTGSTYTCAYVAASGNSSIGQGHTHTWTSNTAMGYVKRYNCHGQTGGVTVTYIYTNAANTGLGSSITYTAFNGSSGNRHWNAAVLWNTSQASVADDQFVHNCSTNYSIAVNSSYISKLAMSGPSAITVGQQASYNVTVTAPDGGGTPTGTVALFRQASNSERSPVTKNCSNQVVSGNDVALGSATLSNGSATLVTPTSLPAGSYKLYASYTGLPVTSQGLAAHCLTPPQSGLTPATLNTSLSLTVGASSSSMAASSVATDGQETAQPRGDIAAADPQLRVVNRSIVTPLPLSIRCPKRYSAVQTSMLSPTVDIDEPGFKILKNGTYSLREQGIPDGTHLDVQLVCRPTSAPAMIIGRAGYGSFGNDTLTSRHAKSFLFGGFGNDSLTVLHSRTLATGGPGNDTITLGTSATAASGGPGNDRLRGAPSGRSLLVGGLGKDVLIGGRGRTLINALDGSGTDLVVCHSRKNLVMADAGDTLVGPCTRIGPGS
ncbi:MAG: hypothetical protein WCP28_00465 [Actinomycetes bacterium]